MVFPFCFWGWVDIDEEVPASGVLAASPRPGAGAARRASARAREASDSKPAPARNRSDPPRSPAPAAAYCPNRGTAPPPLPRYSGQHPPVCTHVLCPSRPKLPGMPPHLAGRRVRRGRLRSRPFVCLLCHQSPAWRSTDRSARLEARSTRPHIHRSGRAARPPKLRPPRGASPGRGGVKKLGRNAPPLGVCFSSVFLPSLSRSALGARSRRSN